MNTKALTIKLMYLLEATFYTRIRFSLGLLNTFKNCYQIIKHDSTLDFMYNFTLWKNILVKLVYPQTINIIYFIVKPSTQF